MFKKVRRYLKDPYYSIGFEMFRKCPKRMSDKYYLSIMWKMMMGYKIDWHNVRTYNEKIQWLKLYDRRPEYTQMVDKYRVKELVASIIGEEYVIPTLAVYGNADEIDLSQLPDKFVLKCNHDSGSVVICEDKARFDLNAAKRKLGEALNENFYWKAREWPYKNVKPCIFAEQFMEDKTNSKQEKRSIANTKVLQVAYDNLKWHKSRVYGSVWNQIEKVIKDEIEKNRGINQEDAVESMLVFCGELEEKYAQIDGELYYIKNGLFFGDIAFSQREKFESFVPEYLGLQQNEWMAVQGGKQSMHNGWIIRKENYIIYLHSEWPNQTFSGLKDYKFFCFSGEPRIMYIANDSAEYPTTNYYDMDYSPLPLYTRDPPAFIEPSKPQNFEQMKVLAAKLSEGIPHVRVDFYENNGKVLFGEMTFFHMGGFSEIHPKEWNLLMGDWIRLPRKRKCL